jgi:hypothetical protein
VGDWRSATGILRKFYGNNSAHIRQTYIQPAENKIAELEAELAAAMRDREKQDRVQTPVSAFFSILSRITVVPLTPGALTSKHWRGQKKFT